MEVNVGALVRAIKQGDFKTGLCIIEQVKLSTQTAVKLFSCICNVCVKQTTNDNFPMEELYKIIIVAITYINDPTEAEIKEYVSASFHILTFLAAHDTCDIIIGARKVWCPSFLTVNTPFEQVNIYKSLCMLFYKYLKDIISHTHPKKINELLEVLLDMADKLPLPLFFHNGPHAYQKHLIIAIKNEAVSSKLLKYSLEKCSTPEYFEQALELYFTMFVELKLPMNQLYEYTSSFDKKINGSSGSSIFTKIFQILNKITERGLSLEVLTSIHNCMKKIENHKGGHYFFRILQQIFYDIFRKNSYPCKDKLSWEFQKELYKVLLLLGNLLGNENRSCQNCENCHLSRDIPSQLSILSILLMFFKESIQTNKDIPENIFKFVLEVSKDIMSLVHYMRYEQCNNWQPNAIEMFKSLYNTGIYIHRKGNHHKYTIIIFEMVVEECLKVEPYLSLNKSMLNTFLHSSLVIIPETYLTLGEAKKAMPFIAFNVFRCEDELNYCHCVSQWIQVKTSNKRDPFIKKITIAFLLTDNAKEMFGITLTDKELSNILLKEINIYCKFWQSKIPLAECCKQIDNLNDPVLTAEALSLAWFKIPETILPEIFCIISKVLDQLENVPLSCEESVNIAKIYFLQYHIQIKTVRNELLKYSSVELQESTLDDFKDGLHIPNIKWDGILHDQLKISNVSQVTAPLLKSRRILEQVFSLFDVNRRNLLYKLKLFDYIVELAITFLLHSDTIEYLKTLLFCKRLAEMADSVDWIVKSIGLIIQVLSSKTIFPFLVKVNECLQEAEIDVKIGFYINLSKAYLNHSFVEKAIKYYLKAKDLLASAAMKDEILSMEVEFLEWNLINLPCKNALESHSTDSIGKLCKLSDKLRSFFHENDATSQFKLMLSEFYLQSYVHHNYWMKRPREGRSAVKALVDLCRDFVVPLHYAKMFTYSCSMDLLCEKLGDCQAKLDGLSSLLGITTINTDSNKKSNDTMDVLANMIGECALDANFLRTSPLSGDSPEPYRDPPEYPPFLLHNIKCECFYCTSLDYQKLVLTYNMLKGNLWELWNKPRTAEYFYNFALNIYNSIIKNKEEYTKKIKSLLNADIMWDIEDVFAESYANLLYKQGNIWMGTRKYNKISDQLMKASEKIKSVNSFLYAEILIQKHRHLVIIQETTNSLFLSPIPTSRTPSPIATPDQETDNQIVASITPKKNKDVANPFKFNRSAEKEKDMKPDETVDNPSGIKRKVLSEKKKGSNNLRTATTSTSKHLSLPKIKVYNETEDTKSKENVPETEQPTQDNLSVATNSEEVNKTTSSEKSSLNVHSVRKSSRIRNKKQQSR